MQRVLLACEACTTFTIDVTWGMQGGRANAPPKVFQPRGSFGGLLSWRRAKKKK